MSFLRHGYAVHLALHLVGKILFLEVERQVHQADEHRHLHQRSDDRGKCLAGVQSEHRDGHGDCQLEVVAGRGEGQGGGLGIIRSDFPAHEKRDEEHDQEIEDQGNGDAQDVERDFDDVLALEREHDNDGEEGRPG